MPLVLYRVGAPSPSGSWNDTSTDIYNLFRDIWLDKRKRAWMGGPTPGACWRMLAGGIYPLHTTGESTKDKWHLCMRGGQTSQGLKSMAEKVDDKRI